eukprot:360235_1
MPATDSNETTDQTKCTDVNETTDPRFDLRVTDYFIVLFAALTFCLFYFYRGSLSPIVDVLEQEFHATSSQIGQMSSLFYVGYTIMQIPSGFALEILTPEFVILSAGLGFAIASFLFGLSPNIEYASIILSITGVLGGPVFIAYNALIGQRMGNNALPLWSGIMLFYTYFFLMGMNSLQAYLWDEHQIWREVYYVLAGSCVLVSGAFFVSNVCHKRAADSDIDIDDWQRSKSFSLRERDISSKLGRTVIKAAFCNRWNYVLGLCIFSFAAVILGFNGLWMIPFLMNKYGYERAVAAIISNLFYISSAIGGLVMGKLSTKYKKRKPFMTIASVMLCCSSLIIHLGADTNMFVIVVLNCIAGCGAGILPVLYATTREYNVFYNCEDIAGGIVNSIANMAGVVFQFTIGFLIDVHWTQRHGKIDTNGKRIYTPNDYEFGLISIDIAICLAIIMCMVVKETNGQMVQFKANSKD